MTPWKIAMEAAAQLAYDMATEWWEQPQGAPDYNGEDLKNLSDKIEALPEDPAFLAALEADEEVLREAAEALRFYACREGCAMRECSGGDLPGCGYKARALLAKLEERLR